MPVGRIHNKINLTALPIFITGLYYQNTEIKYYLFFMLGFVFSTFFFNPDTDLRPKKNLSFFKFFFYPYSLCLRHRCSASHSLIFSTILRTIYILIIFLASMFIYYLISPDFEYNGFVKNFLRFLIKHKKFFIYFLSGFLIADSLHIVFDRIYSFIKFLYPK